MHTVEIISAAAAAERFLKFVRHGLQICVFVQTRFSLLNHEPFGKYLLSVPVGLARGVTANIGGAGSATRDGASSPMKCNQSAPKEANLSVSTRCTAELTAFPNVAGTRLDLRCHSGGTEVGSCPVENLRLA